MTLSEYEAYITTMNEIEERIEDDDRYPVVKDNRLKLCCKYLIGFGKFFILYYNNGTKKEV